MLFLGKKVLGNFWEKLGIETGEGIPVRYETKRLKSSIRLALMTAIAALPMTVFAAADEPEVYDLEEVEVVGVHETAASGESEQPSVYAGGQIARTSHLGVLGERDFMDVPFNVTTFNNQMIENQQASSIVDVITNDPSVSDMTLSSVSQAWMIRGFKAQQQDTQLNGIYGVAPRFYGGIEYVDRVEVLKGVGALLNGMAPNGSLGGTINFIPKRAEGNKASVTLSYGNQGQFTQHFDISRRSNDNKFGVRLNLLNNNGEGQYDGEHIKTHTGFIGVDYNTGRSRMTFDAGIISNLVENAQYRLQINDNVIRALGGSAPRVDINTNLGAPGTFRKVIEKFGLLRSEYDIDKNITAYAAVGMRITHQDTLSSQVTLRDANGTLRVVHRYNNQINKAKSAEIGLKGKFETGVIKHDMTLAASYMHYDRYMFQNALSGKTYDTNLYHLQWKDLGSYLGPLVKRLPLNDSETLRSIALSDVMATKDDRWTFIAGGRLQQIIIDEYSNRSHYEETKFSPAFALVHKPTKRLSLYANYIQGLKDGDETSSSAANPNEKMKPFVAKQYEVGAKYDFGKMATMLSAFSITNAAIVRDPVTLIESANGEVRNRGLEWMFFGEPRKGTRITGGITWLNARYEKTTGGINDGKIQDGSPRTTVVFGVEQDIHGVAGLSLSARMTYNSSTYANAANTFRVAPWTRVDVGARYRFKAGDTPVTIRADVYNVFNRNYWHALDRGAVYLGAPRTFMLSMTADF